MISFGGPKHILHKRPLDFALEDGVQPSSTKLLPNLLKLNNFRLYKSFTITSFRGEKDMKLQMLILYKSVYFVHYSSNIMHTFDSVSSDNHIRMKYFFTTIAALCLSLISFGQNNIPIDFDERVELVSAVFHLAGAQEYNSVKVPSYEASLDSAMAGFIDHQVVALAREYGDAYGISYDAVVAFSLHLKFASDSTLAFDGSFLDGGDDSFERWPEKARTDFLIALNDFYEKSGFHSWFESTAGIRADAVNSFDKIGGQVDLDWFESFFEKRDGARFKIILSILIGPNNYGCHARMADGTDLISPVIGCCQSNGEGNVGYKFDSVFPILIHEFSHSYCNPLDQKYWELMKRKAARVFRPVRKQLNSQAYDDPQNMVNETFVRASVICYLSDHFPDVNVEDLIFTEQTSGFMLTRTFVNSLMRRWQGSSKSQTMDEYMPNIAADMKSFSMRKYKKELREAEKLLVHYSCNIRNRAKLPAGEFSFVLTFDRPMVENIALGYSAKGFDFPEAGNYFWSEDKTTQTVVLNLKPGTKYGFRILGTYYRGQDGKRGAKDTEVFFRTR